MGKDKGANGGRFPQLLVIGVLSVLSVLGIAFVIFNFIGWRNQDAIYYRGEEVPAAIRYFRSEEAGPAYTFHMKYEYVGPGGKKYEDERKFDVPREAVSESNEIVIAKQTLKLGAEFPLLVDPQNPKTNLPVFLATDRIPAPTQPAIGVALLCLITIWKIWRYRAQRQK